MIDPFNADDLPDEVLWEISDPDYDIDEEDRENYYSDGFYSEKQKSVSSNRDIISYPEHKKIKKSQQTKSFETKEKTPSKNKEVWWLYSESDKIYKKYGINSGKWLIFLEPKFIDAAWDQVKYATEQGLLGGKSKVSTLKGFVGDKYVICIYTYNWKDEKDVMRIREVLRDLGFDKPLPYKSDADTRAGKYEKNGHKNISKYYI